MIFLITTFKNALIILHNLNNNNNKNNNKNNTFLLQMIKLMVYDKNTIFFILIIFNVLCIFVTGYICSVTCSTLSIIILNSQNIILIWPKIILCLWTPSLIPYLRWVIRKQKSIKYYYFIYAYIWEWMNFIKILFRNQCINSCCS